MSWSLDEVFARRADELTAPSWWQRTREDLQHVAARQSSSAGSFFKRLWAAGVIGIVGLVAGGVMAAIGRIAGGSQPSADRNRQSRSGNCIHPHDHLQPTQRGEHDDIFRGVERRDPKGRSNRAGERCASGRRGKLHRPERGGARTRRASQARSIQSVLGRVPARRMSGSVRPAERPLRVSMSRFGLQWLDRSGPTGPGVDGVVQYPYRPRVKRTVVCRWLRAHQVTLHSAPRCACALLAALAVRRRQLLPDAQADSPSQPKLPFGWS